MLGLLVLIGITIIASMLLPSLGIDNKNVVLAVMAGLVIGHFVGTSLTAVPTKGAVTKSPNSSEIKTIYVGNLAFHTSKYDLYNLFKQYGKVHSSRIMFDKVTKKSRGFGFVEMNAKDAEVAIESLDGKDFSGRSLRVNEASNQAPFMQPRFQ